MSTKPLRHSIRAFPLLLLLGLAACSSAPPSRSMSPAERDAAAMIQLGALLEQGDFAAALSGAEAFAAAKPEDPERQILLASVRVSSGDLPGAKLAAEAAAGLAPKSGEPWRVLAEIASYSGDKSGRKAALDQALSVEPNHAGALASRGDIEYEAGAWAKAEEYYRKAVAADPANLEGLLGLGRSAYRKDDYKASAAFLDLAVAAHPRSSLALADRARARYMIGQYDGARSDLDGAIAIDPDSAWHRIERGRLMLDLGKRDEALADFAKAIELDPEDFLPYVYRAGMYEEEGRDALALADYRSIVRLYPDYWYAFESIGATAFRLGDWVTAREGFEKSLQYSPAKWEYAILAAICRAKVGDLAGAKDYAASILPKIDREKYPGHWLALRLFYDRTDITAEIELRISSEKRLDDKAALLFWLGEYWFSRDKQDLGAKYLGLSLDLDRQGSIAWRLARAELERKGYPVP